MSIENNNPISLEELQGPTGPTGTPGVVGSNGPRTMETQALSSDEKYQKVNIGDIVPYSEPEPGPKQQMEDEMSINMEMGLERFKRDWKRNVIDPVKEELAEELLEGKVEINGKSISISNEVQESIAKQPSVDFNDEKLDFEKTEDQQQTKEFSIDNLSTSSNPFDVSDTEFENDLLADDVEEKEDEDANEEKIAKEQMEDLKVGVSACIKQNKFDLSKFTINKKPTTLNKVLSIGSGEKHTADWILYTAGKSVTLSEISGSELEKFNPNVRGRNRLNTFRDMYTTFYNHLIDANKPPTVEAWTKTLIFFDLPHLHFTAYKACFDGANYLPYTCPHCNKITIDKETPISSMIKYKDAEVKAKAEAIYQKDSTSASLYESTITQISDKYAISFRLPTVYSVVFENSVIDEKFSQTYGDMLAIMSYIDEIYYIDEKTMSLVPISTHPVPTDLGRTVRNKIKVYQSILKSMNSDQYGTFLAELRKVNTFNNDDIKYVFPAIMCPKCNKEIPEMVQDPQSMLFTRHQLVAMANS